MYRLMLKDRKGKITKLPDKYRYKYQADDKMKRIITAQDGLSYYNPGLCFSYFGKRDWIEVWRIFE